MGNIEESISMTLQSLDRLSGLGIEKIVSQRAEDSSAGITLSGPSCGGGGCCSNGPLTGAKCSCGNKPA